LPQSPRLRGGQFGRARFTLDRRPVLTIPTSAIATRGQLQMVFSVEAGVARTRMITTGATSGTETEVLSGLSTGEPIVSPVPASLTDGQKVEVRQ